MVPPAKLRYNTFFLLLCFLSMNVQCGDAGLSDSWIAFAKESKHIVYACINNKTESLFGCLRSGSLVLFDRITSSNVIPLTNTVRLIRYHGRGDTASNSNDDDSHIGSSRTNERQRLSRIHPFNSLRAKIWEDNQPSATEVMDSDDGGNAENGRLFAMSNGTWAGHVLSRLADVLSTHVIQLDVDAARSIPTGRARHRHQQVLPTMIFGVTALGMILVPIGFQMLSLFAGKALLLSKLALLLASMNGFKRIATSGVQYGLYHQDPPLPHVHYGWDRNEHVHSHPRNLNLNVNTSR